VGTAINRLEEQIRNCSTRIENLSFLKRALGASEDQESKWRLICIESALEREEKKLRELEQVLRQTLTGQTSTNVGVL
jgi:hypothetical protein